MPTDQEHNDKVLDNRTFLALNGGLVNVNPRWAAVVAFYEAVHLVERLAAHDGVDNKRHTGNNSRQLYLSAHPRHHVLLADLTALRSASEDARYESLPTFDTAWPPQDIQAILIDIHLANVRQYVSNFFAPPAGGPAVAGS